MNFASKLANSAARGRLMERILIVDDGRENREFIAEYVLEPNGYQALTAKDGKEGLDMIIAQQPDLILLDYQLPRMNGIEVLEALSERGINIPVILMTFYGSEEVAVEVYRLGVRDYVKKPFSVDEMLMAIERCLGDVRLRREKEALTERLIAANRDLQSRLQELNILYSIGKIVAAATDVDQFLPRIVDAAVKITSAEEGCLHLVEDDKLVCRASKPPTSARAAAIEQPVNDPVAQYVIQNNQPLLLTPDQLANTPNATLNESRAAPRALAAAPLVVRGQIIGVIEVINRSPNSPVFTKNDSAMLSTLSDYAALGVDNVRNLQALQQC